MSTSALSHLECSRCQREQDADCIAHVCSCGGPLLARYDLALAARTLTHGSFAHRADNLWRLRELLPVRSEDALISLGERATPIVGLRRAAEKIGIDNLLLKDDGLLPTGSFKARGAAVGVSRAHELGVTAFAMPTNGNAGTAWSAYAARVGMSATIVMPALAAPMHRSQCELAGARVFLVDGLIGDAGRIVARAAQRDGLYDASTLKEPYRIEGKKTLGFEIAEQFDWTLPDVIIYPTGGGVGLIGMHKAFCELQALGLLEMRLPRFVAVQSSGCAPIVQAWQERRDSSIAWENPSTVAFGINVPKALGDFLVLRTLYETCGVAVAVDDEAILEWQQVLVSDEGVAACAEGGATLAAAALLARRGEIAPGERVLLVNTGSCALSEDVVCSHADLLAPDDDLPPRA